MNKLKVYSAAAALAVAGVAGATSLASAAQQANIVKITGVHLVTDTATCKEAFEAVGGATWQVVKDNIDANCAVNDTTSDNSAINAYPWIIVTMDRGVLTAPTDYTVTVGDEDFTATGLPQTANPFGYFSMSLGELYGAQPGDKLADFNLPEAFAEGAKAVIATDNAGVTLTGETEYTFPVDKPVNQPVVPKDGGNTGISR